MSDKEVNALLKSALNDFKNEDLYLHIFLAVYVGMRKGEILTLEVGDLNFRSGAFDLKSHKIKTRTPRKLNPFIPKEVSAILKSRVDKAIKNNGTFIFPKLDISKQEYDYSFPVSDISKDWDNIRAYTGIDCLFKDLRATFITNAIKEGVPPITIAAYCGNCATQIQKVYDKIHHDLRVKIKGLFAGRFYAGGLK